MKDEKNEPIEKDCKLHRYVRSDQIVILQPRPVYVQPCVLNEEKEEEEEEKQTQAPILQPKDEKDHNSVKKIDPKASVEELCFQVLCKFQRMSEYKIGVSEGKHISLWVTYEETDVFLPVVVTLFQTLRDLSESYFFQTHQSIPLNYAVVRHHTVNPTLCLTYTNLDRSFQDPRLREDLMFGYAQIVVSDL